MGTDEEQPSGTDFIRQIIAKDGQTGKFEGRVVTRFPPEPNGYLHIGHAKSICLNFGIAEENDGGVCHLRLDDTNPETEEQEYLEAIKDNIRWLGFRWGEHLYHASDYFEQLYKHACTLIEKKKAYVCSLTEEEVRAYRGTVTEPGTASPYRERTVAENLQLFEGMRAGDFEEGQHVLRALIDMASPNMKMRDPPIYRIRKAPHYRTQDAWCAYPMYDFAHCLSDSIEGVTHSLCTLEFENNRELYDWFLDTLGLQSHPQQIEFARLNLSHTITSKRKLLQLVEQKLVHGWDDPRMPTLAGLRRRGYTPESIRNFCERIGVARAEGTVEMSLLEHCVRDDLNQKVRRAMCVVRPLRLVIDNFPEDLVEELEAPNFPDDPPRMGSRKIPFSRVLYIEQTDFLENPPKKFFRLAPGREVRLRWGYLVTCTHAVKNDAGEVVEVHCTYDPETKGGSPPDGRRVKGTIHWVSEKTAVPAEVRLYEALFNKTDPTEDEDFLSSLNPNSLEVLTECWAEPNLAQLQPGERLQLERQGYFTVDRDSSASKLVLNRTVPLRDSWAKIVKKEAKNKPKKR